tara:strand:- start:69 stop:353 length:285 start_codon:yes stop_codon:yes gene_type:complete
MNWFEILKYKPLTGAVRMKNLIKESVRDLLLTINIGDTFSIQDIVDSADDERITPEILSNTIGKMHIHTIKLIMTGNQIQSAGWKIAKRFKKVR